MFLGHDQIIIKAGLQYCTMLLVPGLEKLYTIVIDKIAINYDFAVIVIVIVIENFSAHFQLQLLYYSQDK